MMSFIGASMICLMGGFIFGVGLSVADFMMTLFEMEELTPRKIFSLIYFWYGLSFNWNGTIFFKF